MDHFWTELTKMIGPISATVRGALEQTKFIHAGLSYLDENAIDRIEIDIRQLPTMLQKPEAEIAALIGNYPGDIKNFQFLTGERAFMLMIATKVTQYGFHRFFRASPPPSPLPQLPSLPPLPPPLPSPSLLTPMVVIEKPEVIIPTVTEVVHTPASDKDSEKQVKAKIFDYYDRRRNDNRPEEESFFDGLGELQVEISHDSIGPMARIVCPFCDPETVGSILIRRDRSGTWKVSNFSAHIKMKHDELVYPGKETGANGWSEEFNRKGGRKRSRSFVQNVPLGEDLTDEHSQMEPTVKCELTEW